MPGLGDILGLFAPNPSQQLANQLNGPNPNAGPQPGAAPGAQPSGQQTQPVALQSSPDMAQSYHELANPPNLMDLYMQMNRRQQAINGINQGIALIAANHSGNPAMARAIMESANAGEPDANATFGNLMNIYSMQRGTAALQEEMASAPDIAAKTGLPESYVRAEIMAGRGGELMRGMAPTDLQKNYAWARQTYTANHPGATPEEIDQGAQNILLGAGGMGGLPNETKSRLFSLNQWKKNNPGKEPPGYFADDERFKVYNQDLADAKQQFNGVNDSLAAFINDMSDVSNSKELDSVAGHPLAGGIASASSFVSPEAYNLYKKMQSLGGTAHDMASRGGPKGVGQNLKTLGSNPEAFTDLGITDYRGDVIAPKMRQALKAQANAFGASGQANAMPGYLKLYLDPMYGPGGELDIGGPAKAVQPNSNLKQPNAQTLARFRNDMEHRGPEAALANLESQGFDTSSLR